MHCLLLEFYVGSLFCSAVLCFLSCLKSSCLGRESWLLDFYRFLDVMLLLMFMSFRQGAAGWSVVCDCGI